ncbi:13713_t:CDS:1 [Acaulospora morrowiae]|uniref:13713_t:CDS:1 n=1 Tax=Acaulospora morrowiae TaxID=94023 RepID=A0A9N8VSM5_9GLOM|nr:13713_t:CDS:1 [Acaulospora morrowiae]
MASLTPVEYTSKIFHNIVVTPAQEFHLLNELVKSAAVAIHNSNFKSGFTFEHVGMLLVTSSNVKLLVHSGPMCGTVIDLFTFELARKYRITEFYKPLDGVRVRDFYVTSGGNKPWGWGSDKAGMCTDSVWRMLETLFDAKEGVELRFEWADKQHGSFLSSFLVDISYFWIMRLYFGNRT